MSESNKEGEAGGLKKLLDPTYPLLQKFREACPGTYKHSQVLVSMMETIAIPLELDLIKMKVAAQYHDIGKMFNPKGFTENQTEGENIHDRLKPEESYVVITKHVSDSSIILINDHNFPRDVIEIITQHHGDSVLRSIFNKSGAADNKSFRYKTKKPTCIEAAVLMVSDCIEATSRSSAQYGSFNHKELIEKIITELIQDDQLGIMRLWELKELKEALLKELEGTYQKRVAYDEALTN